MTEIVEIALESLTADAFAPYGQLIAARDEPPVFEAAHLEAWQMEFAVDGEIELMVVRYIHQEMRWTTMERHFNITQSFMALGGAASVMMVADPTDANDRSALPRPETVRAFMVDCTRHGRATDIRARTGNGSWQCQGLVVRRHCGRKCR